MTFAGMAAVVMTVTFLVMARVIMAMSVIMPMTVVVLVFMAVIVGMHMVVGMAMFFAVMAVRVIMIMMVFMAVIMFVRVFTVHMYSSGKRHFLVRALYLHFPQLFIRFCHFTRKKMPQTTPGSIFRTPYRRHRSR